MGRSAALDDKREIEPMAKVQILINGQVQETDLNLTLRLYRSGHLDGDTPVRYENRAMTLTELVALEDSASVDFLNVDAGDEEEVSLDDLGEEPVFQAASNGSTAPKSSTQPIGPLQLSWRRVVAALAFIAAVATIAVVAVLYVVNGSLSLDEDDRASDTAGSVAPSPNEASPHEATSAADSAETAYAPETEYADASRDAIKTLGAARYVSVAERLDASGYSVVPFDESATTISPTYLGHDIERVWRRVGTAPFTRVNTAWVGDDKDRLLQVKLFAINAGFYDDEDYERRLVQTNEENISKLKDSRLYGGLKTSSTLAFYLSPESDAPLRVTSFFDDDKKSLVVSLKAQDDVLPVSEAFSQKRSGFSLKDVDNTRYNVVFTGEEIKSALTGVVANVPYDASNSPAGAVAAILTCRIEFADKAGVSEQEFLEVGKYTANSQRRDAETISRDLFVRPYGVIFYDARCGAILCKFKLQDLENVAEKQFGDGFATPGASQIERVSELTTLLASAPILEIAPYRPTADDDNLAPEDDGLIQPSALPVAAASDELGETSETPTGNYDDALKAFKEMNESIKSGFRNVESDLADLSTDAVGDSDVEDDEDAKDAKSNAAEDALAKTDGAIRVGDNIVLIDHISEEEQKVKTWEETLSEAVDATASWEKKAPTITVPDDAATLVDAIAKAAKGDVILLKGGNEIEVGWKSRLTSERSGLVIDKAVAIIGEEGATVVVEPGESLWITSKNVALKNVVFKTNAKSVAQIWRPIVSVVEKGSLSLKECRFIGVRENEDSVGVSVNGDGASAKLWKCSFEDFGNSCCLAESKGAIESQYSVFERCKYGLCAETDATITAERSRFVECSAGCRAESGAGGSVEECFFKSCANPVGTSMGSSGKVSKSGIIRED